jgi:uncharacterized membrane protein
VSGGSGKGRRRDNRRQVPDRRDQPSISVSSTNLSLTQSAAIYTSPILPSPEELARFDELIPHGAERIFDWVVGQTDHRQTIEKAVVFSNIAKEGRGQWMAVVVCLSVVFIGGGLLAVGKDIYGFYLTLTPLAALAGTFITGKVQGRRELMKKRKELEERGITEPQRRQ